MTGFEVLIFGALVIFAAVAWSKRHQTQESGSDNKLVHRAAYLTGKNVGQTFTRGMKKKHLRRVK